MRTLIAIALLLGITGCSTDHIAAPPPQDAANLPVVFIGDSITHNWADPQYSNWFTVFPQWINEGVIGQNSVTILARYNPDAIWLDPKIIHIIAGTNDVYPDWVPCNINNMPQFSTCANIAQMALMAKDAGIKVILGTIPPWGCAESNCELAESADSSEGRYVRIAQLNAFIKEYGAANAITVVDYHAALVQGDDKHYQPGLTVDGVHPNAAGYNTMTPLVITAIEAQEESSAGLTE
jgi:acyl-CoA thioesterase I